MRQIRSCCEEPSPLASVLSRSDIAGRRCREGFLCQCKYAGNLPVDSKMVFRIMRHGIESFNYYFVEEEGGSRMRNKVVGTIAVAAILCLGAIAAPAEEISVGGGGAA